MPMIAAAAAMFVSTTAKLTPTASASMLVATACTSKIRRVKGRFSAQASGCRISLIASRKHVPANQPEQDKSDPVINRGNGLAEEAARKIADHRHDGLKYAKGDAESAAWLRRKL